MAAMTRPSFSPRSEGSNVSATSASPADHVAAPDMPCSSLAAISTYMLSEKAKITFVRASDSMPMTMKGHRPIRSDNMPKGMLNTRSASENEPKMMPICTLSAPSVIEYDGSTGIRRL